MRRIHQFEFGGELYDVVMRRTYFPPRSVFTVLVASGPDIGRVHCHLGRSRINLDGDLTFTISGDVGRDFIAALLNSPFSPFLEIGHEMVPRQDLDDDVLVMVTRPIIMPLILECYNVPK
jgi:hypothetical protein